MTTRVFATFDEGTDHHPLLHPGVEYPVEREYKAGEEYPATHFTLDNGRMRLYCSWKKCGHLLGGNWRRIEREIVQ